LASLLKNPPHLPFEILVVDDASTDRTSVFLQETAANEPRIRSVRNQGNLGFARSCNHGARAASGTYLLFLNNDTEVCSAWFPPLFAVLENNPDVGIVGPKLLFPNGTIQHCGKIWKDTNGTLSQPHHIYYRTPGDAPFVNESREYQMLTGACIMVRRIEFLTIGPLDEEYENGWEDDDICYAYRAAGKSCYYCAESTVIHHESKSLNEKIKEADEKLADHRRAHATRGDDRETIERENQLISDIEQHLLCVRERFLKNRKRFFSKWKEYIVRDDFQFYNRDGIPFVTIIIPVFNRLEFTEKCLEALFRNTAAGSYELILVDNGSTDGTADFLKKQDRISQVVSNPDNLGFAKACNQGAEAAHGAYLVFLNNDTEPQPGWLDALVRVIHADPVIGAVGSKLLYPDGTIQHAGVVLANDRILHDPLVGKHIYTGKQSNLPEANIPFCYQALTAASLMVRRSVFLDARGFDEGYWNGYEDVDLCFTLRKMGYHLVYSPGSVLIHHESKSGPERFARAGQNIRRLHQKWLGKIIPDFTITEEGSCINPGKAVIFPYNGPGSLSRAKSDQKAHLVSIVILTFNQLDKTRDCIDSIRKHTPELHEIIFIDNGSTDGTVAWLRELCAGNETCTLIENGENRGFAAGCNQGIEAAAGEYVLLLNNDVVVTRDWLGGLLECLRATPDTGIVGPMTNNISGIQQVPDVRYSSGAELDAFAREFREKNRHQRIEYRRIVGFCMLFRKSLTNEIGLLDEMFGTGNFEDDDLCLRAAIAGYRNVIAGDVFIHHVGSASFRGNNFDYVATLTDNGKLFREKWSRPVTDENEAKRIVAFKTLEKAETLFHRGDYDGMVEAILQDGIRQIPEESRFYLALAGYFLDLGRHKDAFDTLAELPDSCSDETRLVLTGRSLAGMGRNGEALAQGEAALRINPGSAPAYHLLGFIAEAQGQLSQAENFWKKAVGCDPGYGEPCTALGILELNSNNPETALNLLERGFLLAPLTGETGLKYHTAASSSGEFDRAEKQFREMHRIYPQHRTIHFLLIDLLNRQGKIGEALSEVESACVAFGSEEGMLAAGLEMRRSIGPITIPVEKSNSGTSVSLCMIVKNERENLPRTLQNLKPMVDEILIVDTGSHDGTPEIAKLFGAHVFHHEWTGDFSSARNASLEKATGAWILTIDADERISPSDYENFTKLLQGETTANKAFLLETRNYSTKVIMENWMPNNGSYPAEETGAGWFPSVKIRLFPNRPEIRFEGIIHEMVRDSVKRAGLEIATTPVPIHHYGYLDKERQQRKENDYYRLGINKLEEKGNDDFIALFELAIQAGSTGKYEEAVTLWNRAIAINNSDHVVFFNLGFVLLQLGRFEESRLASAQTLELHPGHADAVVQYAMCDICLGETKKARVLLESVLHVYPKHFYARLMLAISRICAGHKEEGLAGLEDLSAEGTVLSEFINDFAMKLNWAGNSLAYNRLLEAANSSGNGDIKIV